MTTIEKSDTTIPAPSRPDSPVGLRERYDNFTGGAWVPPSSGAAYRPNLTPATGEPFSTVADSTAEDIELGKIAGAPFPIDSEQHEPWGVRFITRSSRS